MKLCPGVFDLTLKVGCADTSPAGLSHIHRRGPWRNFEGVEYAALGWVDWFNNRCLLDPIGNITLAEAKANYYAALETEAMAA